MGWIRRSSVCLFLTVFSVKTWVLYLLAISALKRPCAKHRIHMLQSIDQLIVLPNLLFSSIGSHFRGLKMQAGMLTLTKKMWMVDLFLELLSPNKRCWWARLCASPGFHFFSHSAPLDLEVNVLKIFKFEISQPASELWIVNMKLSHPRNSNPKYLLEEKCQTS